MCAYRLRLDPGAVQDSSGRRADEDVASSERDARLNHHDTDLGDRNPQRGGVHEVRVFVVPRERHAVGDEPFSDGVGADEVVAEQHRENGCSSDQGEDQEGYAEGEEDPPDFRAGVAVGPKQEHFVEREHSDLGVKGMMFAISS